MTRLRLKFVQAFGGYYYFRRRGSPRIPLPGLPGSVEFMAAYQQALAAAPKPIGLSRSKPGSVAAAVAAYLSSPVFTTPYHLAPASQAMRRSILQRFRDHYGEMSITTMPPKFILSLLAAMPPHAARNWFKTLRAFCQFSVEQEIIKTDLTLGLKLPKVRDSGGHHTWKDSEVAAFEAKHPVGSKARVGAGARRLHHAAAQRCRAHGSAAHQRGRSHQGGIARHRSLAERAPAKDQEPIVLPLFPELKRILTATPTEHLSFLITKSGRPYSGNDFSDQFRQVVRRAGLPSRCSFHGLRKYGAVWFATRGCSAPEIAAWGGWKSLREVERYIRAAQQMRLAGNALVRVLGGEGGEQIGSQSVKPDPIEVSN